MNVVTAANPLVVPDYQSSSYYDDFSYSCWPGSLEETLGASAKALFGGGGYDRTVLFEASATPGELMALS